MKMESIKRNNKTTGAAVNVKGGFTSRVPFSMWAIFSLIIAVTAGYGIAKFYQVQDYEFTSADDDFKAYFREDPVESYLPFMEDYASSPMLTVTNRHSLGLDEINRLRGVKSPDAGMRLFSSMVEKTNAEIIREDLNDFMIYIPEQNSYVRGRIFFAAGGGTLYRVWSLRENEEDLELPSTIRFLFGIEIKRPD
jgi:hypothetical protein